MNVVAFKKKQTGKNKVIEIELECWVSITVACAEHRSREKCSQLSVQHVSRWSRTPAPQHPSTPATLYLIGWESSRQGSQYIKQYDISLQIWRSRVALFEPVHGELPVCMDRSHQVHGGAHTYQTAGHDFFMDDGEVATCGRHDTAKAPRGNEDFPPFSFRQIVAGVAINMEA